MQNTSRKVFAAAAMAGLLSGAAVRQSFADGTNTSTNSAIKAPTNSITKTNLAPGKAAPVKKMPKVHDCSGENECKGLGGCKTDVNDCKFKNACKAKGGCELTKKDIQDWEKKQKEAAARKTKS